MPSPLTRKGCPVDRSNDPSVYYVRWTVDFRRSVRQGLSREKSWVSTRPTLRRPTTSRVYPTKFRSFPDIFFRTHKQLISNKVKVKMLSNFYLCDNCEDGQKRLERSGWGKEKERERVSFFFTLTFFLFRFFIYFLSTRRHKRVIPETLHLCIKKKEVSTFLLRKNEIFFFSSDFLMEKNLIHVLLRPIDILHKLKS